MPNQNNEATQFSERTVAHVKPQGAYSTPAAQAAPNMQAQIMRQPEPTQGSVLPFLIVGGALVMGFFMVLTVVTFIVLGAAMQPRAQDGLIIDGVNVSGMTEEELTETLTQHFASKQIVATDGNRSWSVSLSQLGITPDVEVMVKSALDDRTLNVSPVYDFDALKAQTGFIELATLTDIPAVDGNPPQNGSDLDWPQMLDRLNTNLSAEIADGRLDLAMVESQGIYLSDANYTGEPLSHTVQAGEELGLIAKQYGVSLDEILSVNDIANPDLLYIGQELKIPAESIYVPTTETAPIPSTTVGKAIVVSTQDQRIYAYENGELIHSHLTSTGRSVTPTVLGDYNIYVKYVKTDMRGSDYYLPDVPYTMYFYQGYGIHGTYWHNKFGRPMSHGCVNLPVEEAQWFFDWAEVGTPVRVI